MAISEPSMARLLRVIAPRTRFWRRANTRRRRSKTSGSLETLSSVVQRHDDGAKAKQCEQKIDDPADKRKIDRNQNQDQACKQRQCGSRALLALSCEQSASEEPGQHDLRKVEAQEPERQRGEPNRQADQCDANDDRRNGRRARCKKSDSGSGQQRPGRVQVDACESRKQPEQDEAGDESCGKPDDLPYIERECSKPIRFRRRDLNVRFSADRGAGLDTDAVVPWNARGYVPNDARRSRYRDASRVGIYIVQNIAPHVRPAAESPEVMTDGSANVRFAAEQGRIS